jgi:heptosyltransferase-2
MELLYFYQVQKILVIQTAFIGDVVLATSVLESLHQILPECRIDILVRKGNETLFDHHPFLNKVLIWDKNSLKALNLFRMLFQIRRERFDAVINLHRHLSTGILTAFSGAKFRSGFTQNPLSFCYTFRQPYQILKGHEVDRNHSLLGFLKTDTKRSLPRIYPAEALPINLMGKYICIAPASVWFTKQLPSDHWIHFIKRLKNDLVIYLLGSERDYSLNEKIRLECIEKKVVNLAGKLSILQSAQLMKGAMMNYSNDSAPQHLATAVNAPITTLYCSTVPEFGFYPLSDKNHVIQTAKSLSCRPCGSHGKVSCPEKHFKCSNIDVDQLLSTLG